MILEHFAAAAQIGPAEWSRLVPPDGVFGTREWSAIYDADEWGNCEYLAVRPASGKAIIGLLPVHRMRYQPSPYYRPDRLLEDPAAATVTDYLLLGARSGFHNVLTIAADLTPADRARTVRELIAGALELARAGSARGVIWPYLTEVWAADRTLFGPAVRWLPGPDVAVFDIGPSYQEHLNRLPSRRRRRFRNEEATFARSGLRIRSTDRIDPGTFAPMVCLLERKYGRRVTPAGMATLIDRVQNSGVDTVCFVCEDGDDQLVGATVAVLLGNRMWPRFIGLDRVRVADSLAYFSLAYYAAIHHLADRGGGTLYLGPEALNTKLIRGARLASTYHLSAVS